MAARCLAAELGRRLGNWICRGRGRGEDLQSACLLLWPEGVRVFYTFIISNFLLNSIREHNFNNFQFIELLVH